MRNRLPYRADRSFKALFTADWVDATFIHYAIDLRSLQPLIPFELDTHDGVAYVSLVAFTQKRLRPSIGGKLAEWLSRPLAQHEFLNVRTYVKNGDERGIHFVAEWIPNRLAALIGPPMYGLPYRVGRLNYSCDNALHGEVLAPEGRLEFDGSIEDSKQFEPAHPGTLDEFLVERYTAWTYRNGVARRFRIQHTPWEIVRADVNILQAGLLAGVCAGKLVDATPVAAHFSRGTFDVRISAPERCDR